MPPSTGAETLQVPDLTVMVRGSFFVAVVVVPVIAVTGATGDWSIILAASAVAATRGTRVAYRRIRRD